MSDVNLTVPAPKEVVDALVALDGLVQKVMAKENALQLATEELPVVIKMLGEVSALPDEVKNQLDECLDAGALFGRRLVFRVLGKDVKPVVVA